MPDAPVPDAPVLDDPTLRAHLVAAIDRFVATLDPAVLDRPVPTCGDWDLTGLAGHLGWVHRWAVGKLEPAGSTVIAELDDPPGGAALGGWIRAGGDLLLEALDTADLDREVDSWAGPVPARFWLRRMAHETAVHAWDAAAALGDAPPLPVDLAVDGVDEVLEVIVPHRLDLGAFGDRASLHLHATDDGLAPGAGEWLVTVGPEGIDVAREHAKGDVAVRAPASTLDLLLWGRRGLLDEAQVFGDGAVLTRFAAAATL